MRVRPWAAVSRGRVDSGGEGLRRSEMRMRREPWRRGVLDRAEGRSRVGDGGSGQE